MKLKVGDIVEFNNYEDINDDEKAFIIEEFFPKYGKVKEIQSDGHFLIESSRLVFNPKYVSRIIKVADVDVDVDSLKSGDEVMAKVTVKKVFNTFLQIEPSVDKTDVVDILKHEEPECFIVREYCYNMYIGDERKLVIYKSKAKIYTSRYTANEGAADMHLNSYDVITYDN